jgi:hypothetical protein
LTNLRVDENTQHPPYLFRFEDGRFQSETRNQKVSAERLLVARRLRLKDLAEACDAGLAALGDAVVAVVAGGGRDADERRPEVGQVRQTGVLVDAFGLNYK